MTLAQRTGTSKPVTVRLRGPKTLALIKEHFPGTPREVRAIPYTAKALIRAIVTAGQKAQTGKVTLAARADTAMRTNMLRSALNMTGSALTPTPEFLHAGRTDKAHKSFYVGNALCAHAAYAEYRIPWLADVERLRKNCKVRVRRGCKKRPDFLGRDTRGRWFVFESKGRSSAPGRASIKSWKAQANAITQVNGAGVTLNIVSAAYISKAGEWEVLWVDPPADEGIIEFDEQSFFEAYYAPVLDIINSSGDKTQSLAADALTYVPGLNAHVGLHPRVREALQNRNSAAIVEFAQRQLAAEIDEASDVTTFADGVMVRLGPTGNDTRIRTKPQDQDGTWRIGDQMNGISKPERETQNRVIRFFCDELGYQYLGDWTDREENSNIEEDLLTAYLKRYGYTTAQISTAVYKIRIEATNHHRGLYGNNQEVYNLLRYGVPVKVEAGKVTETVKLINWDERTKNDFGIAEEVTLNGNHERRPDLVLYVNGIALGVIELKSSRVSIGDGIRQCLSNQQPEFNDWFFTTVQLVFAGNDSEGLQYGTTLTPEKYWLKWKEDEADNTGYKLDKYLGKLCKKERLLELIHDFVLFDAGVKKVPRAHQYFGIKAAQESVKARKSGIIWHTQGSGKSIVMVLLAKWILENNPHARVAIITDRDELDKQIERVFHDAGETIQRSGSGRDLLNQLGQASPRLLCSLVHKFGRKDVDDFEAFLKDLQAQPNKTVGEVFVFVDECHRTQSGKLHKIMKAMMPNAVFIGFTGTPLLKKDKETSLEVFGGYIHTYKFSEGVEDGVVLDLVYEARDIDQRLGSQDKIDAWFEAKTKGLNDWQKDELKKQWGTMKSVLSSKSRMERIVNDIVFDFATKPRLSSSRGNAILVAGSIYEAAKYYALFQKTVFKGKCAVVTSYNPLAQDVTKEETGANTETDRQFLYNTYNDLLKDVVPKPGMTKTETYEERAKNLFTKQPANMKLLVVVDKLLTGFDAPPCTYLYIDKSMQDHGLFQAICRTNRLDGEDKDFGYIVDYKDLFRKVENAIAVYTSELDHSSGGADPEVLLENRLTIGRERLDNALEALAVLCEPVPAPKGDLEYIHYFCGNTEVPADLQEREPLRSALYKATVGLIRAFANIADELDAAGYATSAQSRIKDCMNHYLNVREIIRKASGETLDLKPYEADMRHLIDTYIEADEPRKISPFDGMGLMELIVKTGIANAINTLGSLKANKNAVAETIENNVRRTIIKEHLNDPAFYEKMSKLLDEIIAARKAKAIEYEEYLKRIAELAKRVDAGHADDIPEQLKHSPALRALYNNLKQKVAATADGSAQSPAPGAADPALAVAVELDEAIKRARPDGWRDVHARELVVKAAMYRVLKSEEDVERLFPIVKAQREY